MAYHTKHKFCSQTQTLRLPRYSTKPRSIQIVIKNKKNRPCLDQHIDNFSFSQNKAMRDPGLRGVESVDVLGPKEIQVRCNRQTFQML